MAHTCTSRVLRRLRQEVCKLKAHLPGQFSKILSQNQRKKKDGWRWGSPGFLCNGKKFISFRFISFWRLSQGRAGLGVYGCCSEDLKFHVEPVGAGCVLRSRGLFMVTTVDFFLSLLGMNPKVSYVPSVRSPLATQSAPHFFFFFFLRFIL